MKNLYFKTAMALVAGLFLFSCSSEDNVINKNFEKITKEEKAYQDLSVQLNALNEKYTVKNENLQTRIVSGDIWLAKTSDLVDMSVVGTALCFGKDRWYQIVSAVAASARGYDPLIKDKMLEPFITDWRDQGMADAYLAAIGSTSTDFDASGNAHNKVVFSLFKKYGFDKVKSMTDDELKGAVLGQMSQNRYPYPPNFNSMTFSINFYQISNAIQMNNYSNALGTLVMYKLITNSESSTLASFLRGLHSVEKVNSLKYCVDFRNTVYNSAIPSYSKNDICSAVSVGYASGHIWAYPRMIE